MEQLKELATKLYSIIRDIYGMELALQRLEMYAAVEGLVYVREHLESAYYKMRQMLGGEIETV